MGIACSRDKSPEPAAGPGPDLRLQNTPNHTIKLNPDELTPESRALSPTTRQATSTQPELPPSAAPTAPELAPELVSGSLPDLETTASASLVETVARGPKAIPLGLPSVPASDLNYDRAGFHLSPGGTPRGIITCGNGAPPGAGAAMPGGVGSMQGGAAGDTHCGRNQKGGFGGFFGGIFGGILDGLGKGRVTP